MTARNIDRMHEIELLSFTVPWSREAFVQEMENLCARYIVVESDGGIAAYAGMWLVVDEGHITNVAVHPDFRGRGLGDAAMRALIALAADTGLRYMTLEVRRSNIVAQSLYRKFGFIDVGFRKRYYPDTREDALIMALERLPQGNADDDPFLVVEQGDDKDDLSTRFQ